MKKKRKTKWFDNEIKQLKKKKIELCKKWRISRKYDDHLEYKNSRNHYTKVLKQKKCDHNKQDVVKASNNQKNMWKCLNKLVKVKPNQKCDEINM